jgi:hypothetical protein
MNYLISEDIETFVPNMQDYRNLVSPDFFPCIDAITKVIPNFSTAILECRLKDNQPRVDLEINLSNKSSRNLPEELLKYPEWKLCNDIYQNWIEDSYSLSEKVEHIWLEFDIEKDCSSIPLPCIFLGLNRNNFNHQNLIEISSKLLDHQLSFSFQSNLKYCIDCLPSITCVFYLGAMLSRLEETVRIVSLISSNQILNYLKQIGWSGSEKMIESLLSKLSELTDYMCLSYDVGETIMPRIGLECYIPKQPKYEHRWKLLLDYLVELNLCSESKRNALLNWSGYLKKTSKSSSLSLNNDTFSWNNVFLKQKKPNALIRKISHLKIVYNSDGSLEAKAYLHLCHEPIDFKNI